MEWQLDSPCHSHTYHREDEGPLEGARAGSWSLGSVKQSQVEGCCWLRRDRSRRWEGGAYSGKCLWRKARQPWKQGDTAESCIRGWAITIASLPTRQYQQLNNRETGPSNTWCTELHGRTPPRVLLQVTDALIYRVRAQSGGTLYVPDMPNNREGPKAREPSQCLNRWSYGERLAKEAFWSPATRGLEKDWQGHNSCGGGNPCSWTLGPARSPQLKQLCHLHAQLLLGQSCHRKKKSCIYAQKVALVMSNSLPLCRLWPSRLLCQGGVFSRQKRWSVLANTSCHTLLEQYIPSCPNHQFPWVPGDARTPVTQTTNAEVQINEE